MRHMTSGLQAKHCTWPSGDLARRNFRLEIWVLLVHNIPNFVPLWWNHKFSNVYRNATQKSPTSDSKNFSSCSLNWLIDWLVWLIDWFEFVCLSVRLSDWYVTYQISYPYGGTINFQTCIEMQLRNHQPPIRRTSQAAAWTDRYIGYWGNETEGSPIGLRKNFEVRMAEIFPLQKLSIWYQTEHFGVPEDQIPIWLD